MLTSFLAAETAHGSVASSPLTAAIVVPFVGALAVALVPRARAELHRLVALVFSAATAAITVWVLAAFEGTARFDRGVVDGAVNGVAALVRRSGSGLRHLQSGYVRSYALGVAVGVVALLAYFLSRVAL